MNLSQQFSKYDKTLEKQVPTYSGLLGLTISGNRQVNIENRAGFVYVRLRDNLSEVVQAMNTEVSPVYDFPVLIQRKGNRWIVVGRDDQRYETWGTNAPFLPAHGDQHSFNRDGGGGGDPVFVYPDQFMPLLVYPSGTYGAGNLLIAPYLLQRTSDYVYVGNTGTGNLLIYKPTTADAIIGLVYLNKTTGNPGVLIVSGTPISATITGTAGITPYIPFVSSDQEPLYAFRLVSGTTALGWSNLYNARQLVGRGSSATGSSGGGVSGITVWDEGVPQGTGTVLNFVGANVDVSVSGTVARVFVTGSAGSSLPSFITGSIPFSGADGILTENNPYLRWENTLRGLRIGQNFSQFEFADIAPIAVVANNENESAGFYGYMYGTGTLGSPSFFLNGYRSRGTFLSPTPVKAGDALLTLLGRGYEGGGSWPTAARVRLYADNDFVTGSVRGSRIDLDVIPSGSATIRTQLSIYGDSVNQPTGSTYNIGGIPHTHAYSSLSGTPTVREVLTAARTYYVRTDGSDSNDGLANTSGGAFLTPQKAIDVAATLDSSIYSVTIQLGDGTYTVGMTAKSMAGAGGITIQGNSGTPANVVISLSGSQVGLLSDSNGTTYYVKDLKITGDIAGTTGIWAIRSKVIYSNIIFNSNLIDINIDINSYVQCLGNYSIIASSGRHWYLTSGGRLTCNLRTITLTGTPAWTTAFLDCGYGASAILYNNTYSGAATGKRANIIMNGVVETYGTATLTTVFPGNVNGTTATGGQIG